MSIYGITSKEPVHNNRRIQKKVNSTASFDLLELEKEEEIVSENITSLGNINPFLVLNEINNEEREREILREKGKQLIFSLNQIRLDLLDSNLTEKDLLGLKHNIENSNFEFQNPTLSQIINDIKIRAEVELAKLQKNLL